MQPLETQLWVSPSLTHYLQARTIQHPQLHNRELLLLIAASRISPSQNLEKDRAPDSSLLLPKRVALYFYEILWPPRKQEWRNKNIPYH